LPEWFKLIGIIIVLVGFALKLRTTIVVVVAALVTGLIAGLPLLTQAGGQEGIINMLGRAFSENRLMTLFIITLPAIGLAERYGLQEQSARLIRRVRAATVGRLNITYQLFRILHGIGGIRLNGHASFVRPLIYPMAAGAIEAKTIEAKTDAEVPDRTMERIKASNAASENYGNFYGQNLSIVQAGVLLVYGVMKGLGYEVSLWRLVIFTTPIVILSVIIATIQFRLLDKRLLDSTKEKAVGE
jgi:uncharacterized membrane protein